MRIFLILAGLIGCSWVPAKAQPWRAHGECPPHTRFSGSVCLTNMPASLRNRGICPAGYVSTADGAYCVLASRREWVRIKPGCPEGFRLSAGGEFCVEN